MSQDRLSKAKELMNSIDWDNYDYTTAPGADMSFPDFTQEEADSKECWIPKRFNDTQGMSGLHVPDLNSVLEGETRKMMAVYGVPYEWPTSEQDDYERREFIEPMEEARKDNADDYLDILSQHGMVNEEHYLWCRNRLIGMPEGWDSYEEAMECVEEIEEKKDDEEEYLDAMELHDILDENHLNYIKKRLEISKNKSWEAVKGVLAETNQMLNDRFEKNKEALADELAPYKGVSMEMWAQANAQLAQGSSMEDILSNLGIEMPEWDDINNEWNERMSRDTTATISTVYGQAFTGGGAGQFGQTGANVAAGMAGGFGASVGGDDPISFEEWVKIQNHMNAAASQGIDANAVLGEYNMNAADWGTIGGHWTMKMNSEPETYLEQFTKLNAKYTEMFMTKYASADVEF